MNDKSLRGREGAHLPRRTEREGSPNRRASRLRTDKTDVRSARLINVILRKPSTYGCRI